MTKAGTFLLFIGAPIGVGLLIAAATNPLPPDVIARQQQEKAAKAAAVQQERQDRIDEAEKIRRAEAHGASQDPCPWIDDPKEHMQCFLRSMPR